MGARDFLPRWGAGEKGMGQAPSSLKPKPGHSPGTLGQSLQPVLGSGAGLCSCQPPDANARRPFLPGGEGGNQFSSDCTDIRDPRGTRADVYLVRASLAHPRTLLRGRVDKCLAHQGQRGPLTPFPVAQ